MATTWRRGLVSVLNRLGLEARRLDDGTMLVTRRGSGGSVQRLAPDAWLLEVGPEADRPLAVEPVDPGTWVVQRDRGRRRAVVQLGRKDLRTHLLVDRRAARRNMRQHQRSLVRYLGEEHIAWMLRELEINCVLDVGANTGQYAKQLRRGGYTGRIVSFEPLPHQAQRLRAAAEGDPEWHVMDCALGDSEGESQMNVTEGSGETSSLLPPSDFGKAWSSRLRQTSTQRIRVRRLDNVFDEAVAGLSAPRVYLKMDTQGYDLQVFGGAGDHIKQVLGMQSEVSSVPIYDGMPRLPEQIAVYEAAGFENTGMFPVTRDPTTHRVIEFDVVMIRVDALPSASS